MQSGLPINFGQPSPDQVIGRSRALSEITNAVNRGSSILLTGERRIGKSWILRALVEQPPKGWVAVYTDVEQVKTLAGLGDVLAERITQKLPRGRRAFERIAQSEVKEIKGVPLPQARPLEPVDRLRKLVRAATSKDTKLILVLDELPILAQRLEAAQTGDGLALLQMLRALRLEESNLRLVLAGSIGFHHLLAEDAEIKAAVNDLLPIPIGPLGHDDATELTRRLLIGIGRADVTDEVTGAISVATDRVPFYIQHMINDVEREAAARAIDLDLVADIRKQALTSPQDRWRMRHYDERIEEYFGDLAPIARGVLDAIATSDHGLTFDEILDRVRVDEAVAKAFEPLPDRTVRSVIERLRLDHYVDLDPDTLVIDFCFPVVRDAWRAMQLR